MDESRLADLLSQIQRLREGGCHFNLSDLCRDCPELLPELRRRLQAIHDIEDLASTPKKPRADSGFPSDDPAQGTVPASATGDFMSALSAPKDPATTAISSLLLGRYRVEGLLGRGGFGEVFKARDQLLHRTVAIKKHRSDRRHSEGWSQSLLSEARKLASIEHPNVVRVHDVAEEAGEVLIVSAYIDGSDLGQRLRRRRVSLEEGVRIIIGIAEALHHIHLRDLVHRDVKPGNILLDGQNRPYLSDFGLAVSEEELLREEPGVQGTYAYMSPEQVRGDSHLVDARTDVYALGVVLYEILTGRLPFRGENVADYREQILNRPARPPRTIDDTIPPELERICLKCLSKRMEDRYTTAGDLANDLRGWLNRQAAPDSSRSGPPSPQRSRPWRGVAVGTATFLCFGLALLIAYWNWPDRPLPQTPSSVGEQTRKERGAPQPGIWYDLLEEEPTILFRPERFARQFDPVKRELWWDTKGGCLIRLGTTASGDYELEVTFDHGGLPGFRGVFLGLPPVQGEPPNFSECEALLVGLEPFRRKTGVIFRARPLINLPATRMEKLRRCSREIELTHAALSGFILTVRVKGGELAWVRVDHAPVQELTCDRDGNATRLIGDFGVYANAGGGRIIKARYKIHGKEK